MRLKDIPPQELIFRSRLYCALLRSRKFVEEANYTYLGDIDEARVTSLVKVGLCVLVSVYMVPRLFVTLFCDRNTTHIPSAVYVSFVPPLCVLVFAGALFPLQTVAVCGVVSGAGHLH